MESLRKTSPILVNPQLLTRVVYFGVGLPMPDPTTSTKDNLLNTLDKSFIVGGEVIIKEQKKDKGNSQTPVIQVPPILEHHV